MPGSAPAPDLVGEVVDQVAAVVRAVPGVADLHPGMFGEVGTYLPGRRVPGIRIDGTLAEVHVSIVFGAPVRETAAAVRSAVSALIGGTVDVTVEDVIPTGQVSTRAAAVSVRPTPPRGSTSTPSVPIPAAATPAAAAPSAPAPSGTADVRPTPGL